MASRAAALSHDGMILRAGTEGNYPNLRDVDMHLARVLALESRDPLGGSFCHRIFLTSPVDRFETYTDLSLRFFPKSILPIKRLF